MVNIVLSAIGTIFSIFWIFLYFRAGSKYDGMIEQIDGNEYFGKSFFCIGFSAIELFKINLNSGITQKKMQKLSEMYGKKMAKRIVLIDLAGQFTYTFTLAPLGALLAVLANDVIVLFIVVGLIAFFWVYLEYDKNSKLEVRHETILREFPHVLSQLALLVNAGMPLREALDVTSQKGDGVLYQELKVLMDEINNGVPEYEALAGLADRCGVDSIRKFSSLIIQNVRKGSGELAMVLMELSSEVWRNRVSNVKEEGEKASAKLMIPVLIIFCGILVMVIVPMFVNMNF